jgi:crotonobetainyl-CoA:carnitine CoA-transferase CaiB-like acyl-CoA transferase
MGEALPRKLGDLPELRETARRLTRANELNPDPNTSMVVATAAMLGLAAARRAGVGQQVFVDMFGANAYANFDDFLDYPGKPARRPIDAELMGISALHRLYRCRSGWIFLAAEAPSEEAALRSALADLGCTMTTPADLEGLFLHDDAATWETRLVERGVGCVRADAELPSRFLLDDPLAQLERLVQPAAHATWGEYLRHAALVTVDARAAARGAPVAGEHTRAVLGELGWTPADIDRLIEQRIVGAPSQRGQTPL